MRIVEVNDKMQLTYSYGLVCRIGEEFAADFAPELSPKQMLALGVFGGRYMTDCADEFPNDWFAQAKLCSTHHEASLNYFGVNASQPLAVWRAKGWIYDEDPRGWFQWYCRYYMGRRIEDEDRRQIKRWRAMTRHIAQVKHYCSPGDLNCHAKQRQALLHWAYDSRKI